MSDPLYGILELSKVLKKKGLGLCSILIQIWQFQFWLENNCSNIEGKKIFAYIGNRLSDQLEKHEIN